MWSTSQNKFVWTNSIRPAGASARAEPAMGRSWLTCRQAKLCGPVEGISTEPLVRRWNSSSKPSSHTFRLISSRGGLGSWPHIQNSQPERFFPLRKWDSITCVVVHLLLLSPGGLEPLWVERYYCHSHLMGKETEAQRWEAFMCWNGDLDPNLLCPFCLAEGWLILSALHQRPSSSCFLAVGSLIAMGVAFPPC